MIVTRSPLRITLGGGGTDLPSYYNEHGGFLIAAAIDKYVYITLHDAFAEEFIVKYSKLERVPTASEVNHPIIREAMALMQLNGKGLELTSMADIPAGTGLGSSGSFTTALLKALHTHKRSMINAQELAEQACHVEIDLLHEPIGKQDQYIAAHGGVTCFDFLPGGEIKTYALPVNEETLRNLEDELVIFFTGFVRRAGSILQEQNEKTKKDDGEMLKNLHFVKDLGRRSMDALVSGNLNDFGQLMDEHWQYKKRRSGAMSNPQIDDWYKLAMAEGATGGKLIGAGGGGFLMFHARDKKRLRHAMLGQGLKELRFRFDFEGTKVVAQ
jgi:D-glycero-alpha-D-manno-heptose-7-phosphate kinase